MSTIIAPKCPLCNSRMIERKGKFGAFFGCTRYPSCKGIVSYKDAIKMQPVKPAEVKTDASDFKPSQWQSAIESAYIEGKNILVQARAGSGKSRLEQWIMSNHVGPNEKGVYLAFNKRIVSDFTARNIPSNVQIVTYHALGLKAIKSYNPHITVDNNKLPNFLQNFVKNTASNDDDLKALKGLINMAIQVINLLKDYLMDCNQDTINQICEDFTIELKPELQNLIMVGFDYSIRETNIIDFSDMLYIPAKNPQICPKFDKIFLDEVQDSNIARIQLVSNICKDTTQILAVGDNRQSINRFCGADSNAMNRVKSLFGMVELTMPLSYRATKKITQWVNTHYPDMDFICKDDAIEGILEDITLDKFYTIVRNGNLVLCRNNAPLISPCLQLISKGIKSYVLGREIGNKLVNLIVRIAKDLTIDIYRFSELLEVYHNKEVERLSKFNNPMKIEALNDDINTIKALMDNQDIATVNDLLNKIDSIFSDESDGVCFSTAHKSKGLENSHVFILSPELMPSKKAIKPEDIEQEENLLYVAMTRSNNELYRIVKS